MTTIRLGYKVRDRLTGFEGVVIARTEWIYGCVRITVQSEELNNDEMPSEPYVLDEPQLEELEPTDLAVQGINEPEKKRAGPRPDSKKRTTGQKP